MLLELVPCCVSQTLVFETPPISLPSGTESKALAVSKSHLKIKVSHPPSRTPFETQTAPKPMFLGETAKTVPRSRPAKRQASARNGVQGRPKAGSGATRSPKGEHGEHPPLARSEHAGTLPAGRVSLFRCFAPTRTPPRRGPIFQVQKQLQGVGLQGYDVRNRLAGLPHACRCTPQKWVAVG